MAFDSTNIVSVGGATLKSNYNQLLDNTNFIHDNILQVDGDGDVRLGVDAAIQVSAANYYGAQGHQSGSTTTFASGSLLYMDNGRINMSSGGTLSIVPDSGTIASGQNGIGLVDASDITLYNAYTQQTVIRFWDNSAAYDLAYYFDATDYIQYYTGSGRVFVNTETDQERFRIYEDDPTPNYWSYDANDNTMAVVGGDGNTYVTLDAANRNYVFRQSFGSTAQPYVSFEQVDQDAIKIYQNTASVDGYWSWSMNTSTGVLSLGQSGLALAGRIMNFDTMIRPLDFDSSDQAGIEAAYPAATFVGCLFYNDNTGVKKLMFSDGTDWYTLDATVLA